MGELSQEIEAWTGCDRKGAWRNPLRFVLPIHRKTILIGILEAHITSEGISSDQIMIFEICRKKWNEKEDGDNQENLSKASFHRRLPDRLRTRIRTFNGETTRVAASRALSDYFSHKSIHKSMSGWIREVLLPLVLSEGSRWII